MLGARLGPYKIDGELGTGGMGTVYLASVFESAPELEQGQFVALKVIHPHLLAQEGFLTRFLREAEAGTRVQHENVVRTLGVGALPVEGRMVHYLSMEYVEGRTLRELLVGLGTVPEALLRELAQQIAAGLEAIHAADLVHRDLKPENVLVTPDHHVRIMDLGMARLVEASVALTQEGRFSGSVLYAAPEQLRGGRTGPRADLYALGVMLHELSTGSHPFGGGAPAEVIHSHLHDAPPRLREVTEDASPFLSEVADTLLAKDPARRFLSAASLRDVLREGEGSHWWAARERRIRREREARPRIAVLRDTRLQGRDRELALLRGAWRDASAGRGAAVFLEGEAGIGKTRLVDAFLDEIPSAGAHLLYGSYPPAGGKGALSDALVTCFGAAGFEERVRPYLRATPSLVPAFTAVVRQERAPAEAHPLRGDALQTVFVHLMRSLAEERPLLWIVEDVHNAESDSRRVVLSMVRALAGRPVLLVLTARPGLPADEVAELTRLETVRRMKLGRLSPPDVMGLLRDVLGSEALVDRLGTRVAFRSDGVPLFVLEMIRDLQERGAIRARPDGTFECTDPIHEIEVSTAVRDLVATRLEDLSTEERDLLEVGAVQGYEFDPLLVASVLGRPAIRILQDLARIERHSGVVRPAQGAYRFDHHQIQEVLYGALPEDRRMGYHTLLADARMRKEKVGEASAASLPPEIAVFLAHHHLEGRRPFDARPFLGRALEHLGASYRNERLLDVAERALASPDLVRGRERVDLVLLQAERLHLLGRPAAARAAIDHALELTQAAWDRKLTARVLASLGGYLQVSGHLAEAEGILVRARAVAREAGTPAIEGRVIETLGRIATARGRHEEARGLHEEAWGIARRIGDKKAEAEAIGSLGHVHLAQGRTRAASDRYLRWLELAREVGDRQGEAVAHLRLGRLAAWLGDLENAERELGAALELAREIGARGPEGGALLALALLAHRRGDPDEALRRAEQSLAIRHEVRQSGGVAWALVLLGKLARLAGDMDLARRRLEGARGRARETGTPGPGVLAACLLATLPDGDPVEAAAELEALGDRLDVAERMEAHFLIWQATCDAGHLTSARRLLELVQREAPSSRRSSLVERVPLHRAILEASDGLAAALIDG